MPDNATIPAAVAVKRMRDAFPDVYGPMSDEQILADPNVAKMVGGKAGPSSEASMRGPTINERVAESQGRPPMDTPGIEPPGGTIGMAIDSAPATLGTVGSMAGPGGGFVGGMIGAVARRVAYDAMGVKRPTNVDLFGALSLGKYSEGKELLATAAEQAALEWLSPVAGNVARKIKGTNIDPALMKRAAGVPENAAVIKAAKDAGMSLGPEEGSFWSLKGKTRDPGTALRPSEAFQLPKSAAARKKYEETTKGALESQERNSKLKKLIDTHAHEILEQIEPGVGREALIKQLQGERTVADPVTGQITPGKKGLLDLVHEKVYAFRKKAYEDLFAGNPQPIVTLDELGLAATKMETKLTDRVAMGKPIEVNPQSGGFGQTLYPPPKGVIGEAKGMIGGRTPSGQPLGMSVPSNRRFTIEQAELLHADYQARYAEAAAPGLKYDPVAADVYNEFARAVDKAIERSMEKAKPGSYKDLTGIRSFVRDYEHGTMNKTMTMLEQMAPDKIVEGIRPNVTNDILKVNEVLRGWGEADATKDALGKIWLNDYAFGAGNGSMKDLQMAAQNLDRLQPAFRDAMFDTPRLKQMYDSLYGLSKLAERVNLNAGRAGFSAELEGASDVAVGGFLKSHYHVVKGAWKQYRSHALVKVLDNPQATMLWADGIRAFPTNPGRAVANFQRALRVAYSGAKTDWGGDEADKVVVGPIEK